MVVIGAQLSLDALYALSTNLFYLTNDAIGRVESQMLSYAIFFGVGVIRCHCGGGGGDDCSGDDDPRAVDVLPR